MLWSLNFWSALVGSIVTSVWWNVNLRGRNGVGGCAWWTNVIDGVKKGDCATCIGDLRNGWTLIDENRWNVLIRVRAHSLLYEDEGRVEIGLAVFFELLVRLFPLF